ncbi:MAG: hypothetical protein HQK49_02570 [Oligoflexia bacterium]|nr:hypothetical protein [Oligoflexia bacterium]
MSIKSPFTIYQNCIRFSQLQIYSTIFSTIISIFLLLNATTYAESKNTSKNSSINKSINNKNNDINRSTKALLSHKYKASEKNYTIINKSSSKPSKAHNNNNVNINVNVSNENHTDPNIQNVNEAITSIKKISNPDQDEDNWYQALFAPDNNGILKDMAKNINEWEQNEDEARKLKLTSTGRYYFPERGEKTRYVSKYAIKYLDRRIAEQTKKAKKGSTIYKIGKTQEALRPESQIAFGDSFSIKLKAELYRGETTLLLNNPFIDWRIHFNVLSDRDIRIYMGKELSLLDLRTNVDYSIEKENLKASIDKRITDGILGRVSMAKSFDKNSSTNSNAIPSDQRLELIFTRPF